VETYNSIGKMERYYNPLQRAYKIIYDKLRDTNTSVEISLQMVVKAVNDSAGLDNIIPTLLVFKAYPTISNNLLLFLTITKRVETICKTSNKIRNYYTKQYMEDVFRIRNSLDIITILKLLI
jgi:hypothetical protein